MTRINVKINYLLLHHHKILVFFHDHLFSFQDMHYSCCSVSQDCELAGNIPVTQLSTTIESKMHYVNMNCGMGCSIYLLIDTVSDSISRISDSTVVLLCS